MSKRSGTRASGPQRVTAPAGKQRKAPAANVASQKKVGARAFNRRAQTVQPRPRTRRRARRGQAAARGARGLALPTVSLSQLKPLLRRIPRAAWICALVACLNAICWSIVTPPFEVPDEPSHFAYVKQLVDTGSLPKSGGAALAEELLGTLVAIRYFQVRQQPQNHAIASSAQQAEAERTLASTPRESGSPAVGDAYSQPPLYYALEAIPYSLAKSGTVLDRLALMRLMSALFAALTALFAFLFVREALPAAPWAWTVGGLSVALAPLLGFMSGAVNPDSMLFAVSAALFFCLARAFRRGLDTRGAVAIGALTAIGFLTKLNFVGLVPGVLAGAIVLSVRAARVSGRSAYRLAALVAGIAFSPVLVYAAINALSHHATFGVVSNAIGTAHGSLPAQIDYVWQLYLPRLPGTFSYFPGLSTTDAWFDRFVGFYGWLDTTFPGWVDTLALIPAGALALLCARALVQGRSSLRRRTGELGVYTLIALGLIVLIGLDSYRRFPTIAGEFTQPRYLLPLIPLLGVALALAARGAGRRWGPAVGTLIVVLFLAHDVFSQLLVAGRFYI